MTASLDTRAIKIAGVTWAQAVSPSEVLCCTPEGMKTMDIDSSRITEVMPHHDLHPPETLFVGGTVAGGGRWVCLCARARILPDVFSTLYWWDRATGQPAGRLELPAAFHVIPTPGNGLFVAVTGHPDRLEQWEVDLESGEVRERHAVRDQALHLFADGERVLAFGEDKSLYIRERQSDTRLLTTKFKQPGITCAGIASDETIAVLASGKKVQPVNLESGKTQPLFKKGHRVGPSKIEITADKRLCATSDGSSVRLFDLHSKALVGSVNHRNVKVGSITLTPDPSNELLISADHQSGLKVTRLPRH